MFWSEIWKEFNMSYKKQITFGAIKKHEQECANKHSVLF